MRLLRAEPEPALAAVFEFLGLGVNGGLAPDALARIARADAVDPESENGFLPLVDAFLHVLQSNGAS